MIEQAVDELTPIVGTQAACRALGAAPATIYRRRRPPEPPRPSKPRPPPARALAPEEREAVLAELHAERFVDCSPAQVWATLLDEGRYLASERTMYRILDAEGETRERRNQLVHPPYTKPELLAERPNELWSWDITKLLGPTKWTYFYLYVILDIFSRYVVGWTIQHREAASVAKQLIAQAIAQQGITPGQLTIHADNGSPRRCPTCGRGRAGVGHPPACAAHAGGAMAKPASIITPSGGTHPPSAPETQALPAPPTQPGFSWIALLDMRRLNDTGLMLGGAALATAIVLLGVALARAAVRSSVVVPTPAAVAADADAPAAPEAPGTPRTEDPEGREVLAAAAPEGAASAPRPSSGALAAEVIRLAAERAPFEGAG